MPAESLLMTLNCHYGRQTRGNATATEQILSANDATSGSVKANMVYFPHPILKKLHLTGLDRIKALDAQWKRKITTPTFSWGDSTYVVPATLFDKVNEINADFQAQRDVLKQSFIDIELPIITSSAPVWMGKLFEPDDFPSPEEMTKSICAEISFLPMPATEQVKLASLSQDAVDAIQASTQERVDAAYQRGTKEVWERLVRPVQKMVDKLSEPNANIYDTLTSNIQEIADLVPHLNLVGDSDLNAFAEQVKAKLSEWSTDQFRESVSARRQAVSDATGLLAAFGSLGKRKFAAAA